MQTLRLKQSINLTLTQRLTISVAALMIIIAVFAYTSALTATNTVPNERLGDGSGSVLAYTTSKQQLIPDLDNPLVIKQMKLTLSPGTASQVRVQINNQGAYYNCSALSTISTCSVAATIPSSSVNQLRMIIVE
jgi:hypothetical protein